MARMRAFQLYASLFLLLAIDHNVHGSYWQEPDLDDGYDEDRALPAFDDPKDLFDNFTSTTTTPIKVEEVVATKNESTTVSPVINSSMVTTIEIHQLAGNETTNFTTTTTTQSVINSTSSENDNYPTSTDDVLTALDNDTSTDSTEDETNNVSDESTNKTVSGSVWEDFKAIFTKSYWEKRVADRSYIMGLLLPIAFGFGAGCLITCFICLCRRLCTKRQLSRRRFDKKYDGKGRDDRWMLLDRHHSSDDDETV